MRGNPRAFHQAKVWAFHPAQILRVLAFATHTREHTCVVRGNLKAFYQPHRCAFHPAQLLGVLGPSSHKPPMKENRHAMGRTFEGFHHSNFGPLIQPNPTNCSGQVPSSCQHARAGDRICLPCLANSFDATKPPAAAGAFYDYMQAGNSRCTPRKRFTV